MTQRNLRALIALVTCFVLASPTFSAPTFNQSGGSGKRSYSLQKSGGSGQHLLLANTNIEKLQFEVTLTNDAQAAAIEKGLASSGFKANFHPAKGSRRPYITAEIDRRVDLNQLLGSVSATSEDSNTKPGPFYDLIIYASFDKEGATRAVNQLSAVPGVDAAQSTTNISRGELHVRITGDSPVTAEDISEAVRSAGFTGHFKEIPITNMTPVSLIRRVPSYWPSWLTWKHDRVADTAATNSTTDCK